MEEMKIHLRHECTSAKRNQSTTKLASKPAKVQNSSKAIDDEANINDMKEKSRDTLDENVEKGISSLTTSDFDQEKNK